MPRVLPLEPSQRVLEAISLIPRKSFVSEIFHKESDKDCALNIGHGVNTSKPSTIVFMLTLLGSGKRVLELGTGCGWQTALLTELFDDVHSVEINPFLHNRARSDLSRFNVSLHFGDGLKDLPSGKFDAIIVCFCVPDVPNILKKSLTPDGVIVCPVGNESSQNVIRYQNNESTNYGACGFAIVSS